MGFDKGAFSARLRGKRAEKRLSRAELSAKTGISVDTVAQYEKETGYTPRMDEVVEWICCTVLDR